MVKKKEKKAIPAIKRPMNILVQSLLDSSIVKIINYGGGKGPRRETVVYDLQ